MVDFSDRMDDGDSIASVAWTVTSGITTSNTDYGDFWAEIAATGGTVNTSYTFQAVGTTQDGMKHEKSFIVMVVDR